MKIKEALKQGTDMLKERKIKEANLKAKILLRFYLNTSKEYITINGDKEIDIRIIHSFFWGIRRLVRNEPIQYIIKNVEFMGLNFYINRNVLIPRPDTEILVEEVISIATLANEYPLNVLDLCTGSGIIGVSLARHLNNVHVCASDISEKVLTVAKKNALNNNVEIDFITSDLFNNITNEFDIIVSNPPYIRKSKIKTLSKEVRKEPVIALDGGEDGLDFYREISKNAKEYLKQNGKLALEIGYNQKNRVMKILEKDGYKNIYSKQDLSNKDRIVICERG